MNWGNIDNTLEAWAAVLKDIRAEAQAALETGDEAARDAALEKANGFIDKCPILIEGMVELSKVADRIVKDLTDQAIQDAIIRIKGRSAEISLITKAVAKTTAQNNAAARAILLVDATELIGQLTSVVSQAVKVKNSLGKNNLDASVADGIADVLKAANELFPKLRALESGQE